MTWSTIFRRAADAFSAQGQLTTALAEAERGLTFTASSELRLLAAILAKQLGHPDRMRRHVAAIPVDDSLRGEAEWLLRSYQDPQRAMREAQRATQAPRKPGPHTPTPASTFLDDLLGRKQDTLPARRSAVSVVLSVTVVMIAMALVVASWWWIGPGALPQDRAGRGEEAGIAPPATEVLAPDTAVAPASSSEAVATPSLLPAPTPPQAPTALPNTLVAAPPSQDAAAEVASAGLRPVMVIESDTFDLPRYLRGAGEADLAGLPVEARMVGDTLVLQGFVQLDLQRRRLIQLLQTAPGVRQVNAVDLLVRPQPTYVVQEGDTLWSIVYNIYGNVDRLDEFAAANGDILPSPDALAPGLVLNVLPSQ